MELCTMWVIYISFLHLALSYNVTIFPESTINSVGNNFVNFRCTIQLKTNETTVKHWIVWWKDNTRIVDNDVVLISSSTKYSVYGVSSAARTEYTQMLQVNGIQETDHGMYTCTLVFPSYPPGNTQLSLSSYAPIILRNFISQPSCSAISKNSETGQQQVMLLCTCSPSYPEITLHWIDNSSFLTSESQVKFTELLTLSHIVSSVSKSSYQLFTCRAMSAGSTNTKECVISNQILTTSIAVTQKPSEPFDESSTLITTKTTHKDTSLSLFFSKILTDIQTVTEQMRMDVTTKVTQEKLISSGDKKTTTITITLVAGVIFIAVFIILVLLKKHIKKRKNEESESPEGIDTNDGNQLTSTVLRGDQIDDHFSAYKSSAFKTDMDDHANFYASADLKNVESQKHVDIDKKKTTGANDIYPSEYKKESVSPHRVEATIKFKTDDMKDALTSPSQNEDVNTNSDLHLMKENDMYVSADEVITQKNTENVDSIFNTACSPYEDGMEGNAVISQNEDANTNDDPYPMEENKMYVSADEVKVKHYQAESGDIYAGVVK